MRDEQLTRALERKELTVGRAEAEDGQECARDPVPRRAHTSHLSHFGRTSRARVRCMPRVQFALPPSKPRQDGLRRHLRRQGRLAARLHGHSHLGARACMRDAAPARASQRASQLLQPHMAALTARCAAAEQERECTIGNGMDGVPDAKDVQFSVLQPGAAVATELSEVEARPKSVAILQISGENWKLESLPLTTVRPFLTAEVVLDEYDDERNLNNEEELRDLLAEKIDELIDEMHAQHSTTPMTEHAES
jgi:hypothetical protein